MTISIDQTTNRAGGTFDANGNLTNNGTFAMTYDVENRMLAAGSDNYDYAPDNKRVYKMAGEGNNQVESVYYYSGSKKLGTYQVVYYNPPGTNQPVRFFFRLTGANVYFGGKLVQAEGQAVVSDRLGSVVWDGAKGAHRYFPYGEERTTTTNESSKFGTYFRDATTGLDYADQRFYGNQLGRFVTPDPSGLRSVDSSDPTSWNLYAYVNGDPINSSDPSGLGFWSDLWGVIRRTFGGDDDEYVPQGDSWGASPAPQKNKPKVPVLPTLADSPIAPTKGQTNQFNSAIKRADGLLKGKCADLFGNGDTGKNTLESTDFHLGVSFIPGTATPSEGTYATTEVANGIPTGNVTINITGHFFHIRQDTKDPATGQPAVSDWSMGTGLSDTDFRAFVLLHELGHLTGKLGNDIKDPGLSDAFNQQIMANCFGNKNWRP